MKTVRKVLAFMLAAGLMVSAMSVFASGSYHYTTAPTGMDVLNDGVNYDKGGLYRPGSGVDEDGNYYDYGGMYAGNYAPTDAKDGDEWYDTTNGTSVGTWYWFDDGKWWTEKLDENGNYMYDENGNILYDEYTGRFASQASFGSSDSKSDDGPRPLSDQDIAAINQRAEAEAVQRAANDEGFADLGDMYQAAEKNLSAGEFYNNAVTSTPGIENAVTVGQGGGLIVNGQVTNMSATISKVTNRAYVDSVRIEQEGRVLNVVDVSYPAVNATINFYMPGITGAENIVALQYNAGTWVEVEVVEVRADHVTLNMKGNGVVAFIAK